MQEQVINIYKKSGETPLDCIHRIKNENPELSHLPMTYAGRLDPLAEGVLLVLVGEECKEKNKYLNLSKEYEVEILFGFATDTYDVLGKVTSSEASGFERSSDLLAEVFGKLGQTISNRSSSDFVLLIEKILPEFVGKIKQKYPPYSSRPVNGTPLFVWAREGKLAEIEIPSHDVLIDNIEILKTIEINGEDLLNDMKDKISKVKGDFRQEEIISLWEKELKDKKDIIFPIIKLKTSCGSGVYVRGIANEIGEKLGVPALALKIIRTKVGEYNI